MELYYSASIDIDYSLRLAVKNTKISFATITDTTVKKSLVIPEIESTNKPVKKVLLIVRNYVKKHNGAK